MKDILQLEGADDYVTDPSQLEGLSAPMMTLVKDCADLLERHYPGWLWAVQPFEFGAIIKIFSLRISGEYGYIIKVADIQNDPKRQSAIEAGGEILERYGLPRGMYRRGLLRDKLRDIRGNLIPDLTDKDRKIQNADRDRVINEAVKEGVLEFKTEDRIMVDGSTYRDVHVRIGDDDEGS